MKLAAVLFLALVMTAIAAPASAQQATVCDNAVAGTTSGRITVLRNQTDGVHVLAVGKKSGWVYPSTAIVINGKPAALDELWKFDRQIAKVEFDGWIENGKCFIAKMKPTTRYRRLVVTIKNGK
jgi:hypothetical protein